ncbi:MAG: EF2563 family selenium-dependent molybdenum hydroxylase system protein [Anaerolineales bacterium]|nr:EF2563 family selenium-dependent molybdenum hydroxylase system protein [Anaerolineales bacterium]
MDKNNRVLIRGGGDLASGVAVRVHRSGFVVLVTELAHPLVVRREVSFAEAVFSQEVHVEEITGRLAAGIREVPSIHQNGEVAVLVDRELASLAEYSPLVVVDARMRKRPPETGLELAPLVIGLGPGFTAGVDCHAVVETVRGHTLGRVMWEGGAIADTGVPEGVLGKHGERVLRAPADGRIVAHRQIGDLVSKGDLIASVNEAELRAPFDGALRGLLHEGIEVRAGMKIGDLDPRGDPKYAFMVSDKALAIGGGVLEAILSRDSIRSRIFAAN